jgi:hypothetical protein
MNRRPFRLRRASGLVRMVGVAACLVSIGGCARIGRLTQVPLTIAPTRSHAAGVEPATQAPGERPFRPLFGDTLIGLKPGTADSSRRYLGRLRDGYTSDTLNLVVFGDNRPGYRSARLANEYHTIGQMFSPHPARIVKGLITIPWILVKGLFPDLALIRDIPARIRNMPTWGREREVLSAVLAKIDSLNAHGEKVTAVINSGDLVKDGRFPAHWKRFLGLTRPLSSRVAYFPVAGNHERTDTVDGVENWRTATGLPIGGDRLYYCFDTADGWVRFIALDTNPIVDPGSHWTREVQIKYSEEEFAWLVARVKEHTGPVVVMMHHPPFSAGFHRTEWQRDTVLTERRERMVKALHAAGSSIIVSGHEHSYQRALLTWPDDVLVTIVAAGGGALLYPLPPPAQSAQLFAEYKVAGSVVEPANVFTAETFNFVHMRLWFGGGEFYAYSVDQKSKSTMIDHVHIDLKRYGIPKIDQHKIPIPPAKGPKGVKEIEGAIAAGETPFNAKIDSTTASKRLLTSPPPSKTKKKSPH